MGGCEGWDKEEDAGIINTMTVAMGEQRQEGGKMSHQELPLLLPVVALRVCGHMGFSHNTDELPLLLGGLQSVPHGLLQLLSSPALSVLLD